MEVPVLVAGGGPVGLTVAYDLQRRGIKTLVVERNPSTTRHPKMDVTNGRAMEHFRRMGIAERIRDAAVPRENCMDVSWVTRLNEWELARFRYPNVLEAREKIRERNDGAQPLEPYMRMSQIVLEPILRDLLEQSPLAEVRFGWAFEDLRDDGDRVVGTIREVATGRTEEVTCQLLAGCDGGSSRVRERLGIGLDGRFKVAPVFMVHFRSKARDILQRFGIAWHYQTPDGATLIAQDDDEFWTLHQVFERPDQLEGIDPKQLVYKALGQEFPLEVLQANGWYPHLALADHYGRGRVWMAGDATHQYIPTGGYGMNTGISDGVNLAWKFAAFLQGWGGPELLASIEAERRPVGARNRQAAMTNMQVRLDIVAAYDEAVHRDDAAGAAAREKLGELIVALGNAENEALGIELDDRYVASPVVCCEIVEPEWRMLDYTPSTWPGMRAPHVFLADGTPIFDHFGPWFTLICFTDVDTSSLIGAAAGRGVPVKRLDIRDAHAHDLYERNLVLVRPDGHVAWRGNSIGRDPLWIIDRVTGASR